MVYCCQSRLAAGKVYQKTTTVNSSVISMIYMQKTHQYSLILTAFCISIVISEDYFPVPSLKPNLR